MLKVRFPSLELNPALKKEVYLQTAFLVAMLLLVTLVRGWFIYFSVWQFWLGGVVGILLPVLDHLLFLFAIFPGSATGQKILSLFKNGKIGEAALALAETRLERTRLIFHTIFFQLIFLVLTFWVMTSSGSFFGRGLVLGFALHLLIEEIAEFADTGSITRWLRYTQNYLPRGLSKEQTKLYLGVYAVVLIFFGLFL